MSFKNIHRSTHLCRDRLHGLNQADQQLDGTGGVQSFLGEKYVKTLPLFDL